MDPGSRAAKSSSGGKDFLDQFFKRPCQPELSLGFILMAIAQNPM
jgi:hypothetical protein